jgi:hypothetical protein
LCRSRIVRQQPRADNPNGVNAAIPYIIHRLRPAAREARRHDLRSVDVRICACSSALRNPVHRRLHARRVRRPPAVGSALGDGEKPVGRDILEERGVGGADVAAGAVAPDENGELLTAGRRLGRVVDCVRGETVVGLVGAWGVGASAAACLEKLSGKCRLNWLEV